MGEGRLRPRYHPGDERGGRAEGDRGNEPCRNAVRDPLDRCAAPLRRAHHAHDLREHGGVAYALGAHEKCAGAVHGRADHLRALLLGDRNRLAGHHGFVDGAAPFDDDAVHRHGLSGAHAQDVAHAHQRERNVLFASILSHAAGHLRRQAEQGAQGAARLRPGAQLQHLSEEDQGDDECRRLEVEGHDAVLPDRLRQDAGGDASDEAKTIGHARSQRDQREHVQVPGGDRSPSADEEGESRPENDGRRERELDEGKPSPESMLHRHARQQVAHAEKEERDREDQAEPEPALHVRQLRVCLLVDDRARLERHAADGAAPRLVADDLRMHRARPLGLHRRGRFRFERHPALQARPRPIRDDLRVHRAHPSGSRCDGLRRRGSSPLQVLFRIGFEPGFASRAAEPELAPLVDGLAALGTVQIDLHSADGIDGGDHIAFP